MDSGQGADPADGASDACRLEPNPRRIRISQYERRVRQLGLGVPGNRRGRHAQRLGRRPQAQPEDIDDATKYVALPTPRDLDLGRPLVMSFAAERLENHYDEIAAIFSRKGAYRRFKDFLVRVGALENWYAYEAKAKEKALREWCAENGVEVEG